MVPNDSLLLPTSSPAPQVAYKAWERRMAEIEERAAAAAAAAAGRQGSARVDWSFWTGGGSLQYDEEAEERATNLVG